MEIEKAELELKSFEEKSQNKYAAVVKSWKNNLETLSTFFKYPPEIRRIIYTTNFIENVHRQLRKVFKNRGFTNNKALKKLLFLTIQKTSKKWGNMQNWALTYSQLVIIFGSLNFLFIALRDSVLITNINNCCYYYIFCFIFYNTDYPLL